MASPTPRQRNRKGHGRQLRADLVAAALEIVAESGDAAPLSIREVARRAGVTPPAVYLHFANKTELVHAVLERQFAALVEIVEAAIAKTSEPVSALRAGCQAYLRFARENQSAYRMLFSAVTEQPAGSETLASMPGAAAFEQLVTGVRHCQEAGYSAGTAPETTATLVWVGLHGLATLPSARPDFPWPALEPLLDDLLERVVGVPTTGPA